MYAAGIRGAYTLRSYAILSLVTKHLQSFRETMNRFECNIVGAVGKSKSLLLLFLLSMTELMFVPEPYASAQTDSWRRTANGWERAESWNYLVTTPVGKLRPLTVGTLMQRSWPASFAAVELTLILLIMHFSSARAAVRTDEPGATTI